MIPANDKRYDWQKVAGHIDDLSFSEDSIATVEINGKKLCLGKFGNSLFGFAYRCPHAGASLADGYIDAQGNVGCPLHGYKFSLRNGRDTTGSGYCLKLWAVEERTDGIYMEIENSAD